MEMRNWTGYNYFLKKEFLTYRIISAIHLPRLQYIIIRIIIIRLPNPALVGSSAQYHSPGFLWGRTLGGRELNI